MFTSRFRTFLRRKQHMWSSRSLVSMATMQMDGESLKRNKSKSQ